MNAQSEIAEAKTETKNGMFLSVMETFYSIQGEGFHTGIPAFFIRMGGCDVGCYWCDVKESWEAENYPMKSMDEIISEVKKSKPKRIIVTGGEPLMYNLTELTKKLKSVIHPSGGGGALHLETSGAYPLTGEWDWICFSPKKFKEPLPEFYSEAHELKMIIYNKNDFKFAEKNSKYVKDDCVLFFQPEWSRREAMLPSIIEYVKQNPRWRISLQTHKYIGVR